MKKILLGSTLLLLAAALFAQPNPHDGPPKPPPVAERWKRDSIKLQLYVILQPSQTAGVKNVFVAFYNSLDGLMEQNKNAPPKREAMDAIRNTRNSALKRVFDAGQFDRFETFDPEFSPPPHKHQPPPTSL